MNPSQRFTSLELCVEILGLKTVLYLLKRKTQKSMSLFTSYIKNFTIHTNNIIRYINKKKIWLKLSLLRLQDVTKFRIISASIEVHLGSTGK